MMPNIELADEIVGDLLRGNIKSHWVDFYRQSLDIGQTHDNIANKRIILDNLRELARFYVEAPANSNKEVLATKILQDMVDLRLDGILQNDPNTAKIIAQERDFYEARAKALEQALAERKRQLDDLLNEKAQTKLPPEHPDFKARG